MQNISTLLNNGIKIRQTNPAKALAIFSLALRLSEKQPDEKLVAESFFNIAIANLNLANYPESLSYFNKTLALEFTQNDLTLKAEVLRGIAAQYLRSYNYKEALRYLYSAEQASIDANHFENLHLVYGSFGSLYNKLKLYKTALEYTLKSLEIAKTLKKPGMVQYSKMSAGACYYKLNEFEKAHKYLNESLSGENAFAEANALHFLSSIEFDKKEFDLALRYSERQVEISRKYNYYEYEGLGIGMIGDIFFEKGQMTEALDCYTKGIKTLSAVGEKHVYFSLCKRLINLYENTGEYEKANQLYKTLYEEHTQHLELEARHSLERINSEFELEQIKSEAEEERMINKRLQDALEKVRRLNDSLKDMNREKNDFMNLVIHDLKNPLINILSLINMAKNAADDKSKNTYTESMKTQTERMFNLISRLLDYRAIEDGKIKIKSSEFDTEDIFEDIRNNLNGQAVKKNLTIEFFNQCRGRKLNTDYVILYQIMENLVSNAIKFSPVNKNITLRSFATGEGITFEVKDEGPGFTEGDKQKVFSSFARLSAQPTGNEHSTGLGLSITKKLGALINSRIELESNEGRGAKFLVTLQSVN